VQGFGKQFCILFLLRDSFLMAGAANYPTAEWQKKGLPFEIAENDIEDKSKSDGGSSSLALLSVAPLCSKQLLRQLPGLQQHNWSSSHL
jgi:hypothetical protein